MAELIAYEYYLKEGMAMNSRRSLKVHRTADGAEIVKDEPKPGTQRERLLISCPVEPALLKRIGWLFETCGVKNWAGFPSAGQRHPDAADWSCSFRFDDGRSVSIGTGMGLNGEVGRAMRRINEAVGNEDYRIGEWTVVETVPDAAPAAMGMMACVLCPVCRKAVRKAKFCTECGAKLE